MAPSFPSASRPFPPSPWVAQQLLHPSSPGAMSSSHSGLHDMANALDLNLPPNALRIIVQGQASGRPPTIRNHPASLPARNGETRRDGKAYHHRIAFPADHTNSVRVSIHVRSVPIPKPTTQSPGVTLYQPPPAKARTRATGAAKSKASETAPVIPHRLANTMLLWGDREQSAPQLTYQSTSAVQAAEPQAEATLPPASAEPSAAAGPSTASWGEHQNSTPQRFQSALATAREISRLPGLDSLPADLVRD